MSDKSKGKIVCVCKKLKLQLFFSGTGLHKYSTWLALGI